MFPAARAVATGVCVAAAVLLATAGTAGATTWSAGLAAASHGESQSQALPAAPASVTATCAHPTTNTTIDVTWAAVARASTYSVLQSYDSGSYTTVASVKTTSWSSSSSLATGTYKYEIRTAIGTNWAGSASGATTKRTIASSSPYCS